MSGLCIIVLVNSNNARRSYSFSERDAEALRAFVERGVKPVQSSPVTHHLGGYMGEFMDREERERVVRTCASLYGENVLGLNHDRCVLTLETMPPQADL